MKKLFIATLVYTSLFIVGCSPDKTAEEQAGVIPQHQLKALEKARQTDDLLQEVEKQRQKQLE